MENNKTKEGGGGNKPLSLGLSSAMTTYHCLEVSTVTALI